MTETAIILPAHLQAHAEQIIRMGEELAEVMQQDFDELVAVTNIIGKAVDGQTLTTTVGACMQLILRVCNELADGEQQLTDEQKHELFQIYIASVGMNLVATASSNQVQRIQHQ